METMPRNVILDLLPAYLAGEASEETRALVEGYAQTDVQIARLIRTRTLAPEVVPAVPAELEMKTLRNIRRSIRRKMGYVALATAAILMLPLAAMQFTREVNWSLFDFLVMGVLLGGSGLAYVLLSTISSNTAYRAGTAVAVAAGLLLVWVNLAVGIIGSEDNPANVLYAGVVLVGLLGAGIARLQPRGMARALFAAAITQMLVPVTALLIWRPALNDPPGVAGVFMLNAFFAALFVVSGLLFRHASTTAPAQE